MNYKKTVALTLGILLCLSILLPVFQAKYAIFKENPLRGYAKKIEKPEFNLDVFISTHFQANIENYISRNFGLRPLFVRVYNQLQYSVFKKANAHSILIGKNNTLFAKGYINAYTGKSFIGTEKVIQKVEQLQLVQNDLINKGKNLVVALAASKPRFYSNDIPHGYLSVMDSTNYGVFKELFNQYQINYIDFNQYLIEVKDEAEYPVYPRMGIHWSTYGAYLVGDSIINYVENIFEIDLPDIRVDSIQLQHATGDDNDIQRSLNLLFRIPDELYAYPKLSFDHENKDSISILVISDSFYWQIYRLGIHEGVFGASSKFWFYYHEVYPDQYKTPTNARDLDFREELEKFDLVLLMSQDGTLHTFAWDFLKTYISTYKI